MTNVGTNVMKCGHTRVRTEQRKDSMRVRCALLERAESGTTEELEPPTTPSTPTTPSSKPPSATSDWMWCSGACSIYLLCLLAVGCTVCCGLLDPLYLERQQVLRGVRTVPTDRACVRVR